MSIKYGSILAFHPWPNCFAYAVRSPDTQKLTIAPNAPQLGFFRITSCSEPGKHIYVQLFGSVPFSCVLINATFARLAGFEEGNEIILDQLPPPSACESVEISPLSGDDYQILESGAASLEAGLLSQLRVIYPKMAFPCWTTGAAMSTAFRVVSITPPPPTGRLALLSQSTELHVLSAPSSGSASLPSTDVRRTRARRREEDEIVERAAERITSAASISSQVFTLLHSAAPGRDGSTQTPLLYRILPARMSSAAISKAIACMSVLWTLNESPRARYMSLTAVRLTSSTATTPFALHISLPRIDTHQYNGKPRRRHSKGKQELPEMIRTLLECHPGHALASGGLWEGTMSPMTSMTSSTSSTTSALDFHRIQVQPVERKALVHAKMATVQLDESAPSGDTLLDDLRSALAAYPLLLPLKGGKVAVRAPGAAVSTVTVVPQPPEEGRRASMETACFVVDEHTNITVQIIPSSNDAIPKRKETSQEKENVDPFSPFDADKENRGRLNFRWQSELSERIIDWLDFYSKSSSAKNSPTVKDRNSSMRASTFSLASTSTALTTSTVTPSTATSSLDFSFRGVAGLVVGPQGSGKSSQLREIARAAADSRNIYCVQLVDATSWKGKAAEALDKQLSALVNSLSRRTPALLVIDDIDLLTPQGEEDARLVQVERIYAVLWRVLRNAKGVHVVASARRQTTLHPSLISSGGKRFFDRIDSIEALDQSGRECVLRVALHESILRGERDNDNEETEQDVQLSDTWLVPLEKTAGQLENASIEDIVKIVRRCELEAWLPGRDGAICPGDLEKVVADWRHKIDAATAKGDKVERTLADVGGMFSQKKLMQEVMLWPYKYSSLFSRFRIRLGRGLILHGPSGCGKTLLAQAMVAESGFNLISVKGPELLSKYIGSSEENVRAVFERARSSAPCVLLFDEIDALAPRRGSDTSGVADRVVNQLLTEMDGAEGLTGVFVLGATSRLDLIDEALIRPGRFDYSVHCGYPDEHDRVEILAVLLREVKKQKINMNKLSKWTSGWSGADLKTLITNAYFDAVTQLKESGEENDDNAEENAEVTMENLERVLEDSRPKRRVNEEEKKLGIERQRVGQSATLA